MNFYKQINNIDNLTKQQLQSCLQQAKIAVENYQYIIKNYPSDRMEKHGKPYLKRLTDIRDKFFERLNHEPQI